MEIYLLTMFEKESQTIPFMKVKKQNLKIENVDENLVVGTANIENLTLNFAGILRGKNKVFVIYHNTEKEVDKEDVLSVRECEDYKVLLEEIKGKCRCEKLIEIILQTGGLANE